MTAKTPEVAIRESGYLNVTDTAKLLRAALKTAFPGHKFSVRSDSYAGGASIRVRYTQAKTSPRPSEVDKVAQHFAGASFDGMIDLKSHHTTLLTMPGEDLPREVHMGADYVFVDADLDPAFEAELTEIAKARVKRCSQKPDGPQDWDTNPNAYLWISVNGRVINDCTLYEAARRLARMGVEDPD